MKSGHTYKVTLALFFGIFASRNMPPKKDKEKKHHSSNSFESAIISGWQFIEEETGKALSLVESGVDRCIDFIRSECILMEKAKLIIEEVGELFSDLGNFIHEEPNLGGFISLLVWVGFCYVFEVWMFPLLIPFIFLRQFILIQFKHIKIDNDDNYPEKKVEGKSITEMLKELCDLSDDIDQGIMVTASLIRTTKRTLQFKEPEICYVVLLISTVAAIILYHIHLRYFIIFGSVYLFTKNYLEVYGYLRSEEEIILEKIANEMRKNQNIQKSN